MNSIFPLNYSCTYLLNKILKIKILENPIKTVLMISDKRIKNFIRQIILSAKCLLLKPFLCQKGKFLIILKLLIWKNFLKESCERTLSTFHVNKTSIFFLKKQQLKSSYLLCLPSGQTNFRASSTIF